MSSATPTSASGLHALEANLSSRQYLKDIWDRRDFLIVVPRQDARSKQMTNLLGQAWHLLNPALMILIYYFIFGIALDGNRGVENYVTYLTVGVLIFQLIQRTVVEASTAVHRHKGLIRSIQFPRALLPLSTIIEQLVAFLPTVLLLYVVALLDGVELRWAMLLFPLTLVPITLVNAGFSFMSARIGSTIPDLKDILPHLFRLLLYTSGVIFSIDNMIGSETVRLLMKANPVYLSIAISRWSMLGLALSNNEILALVAWCVVLPIVGFTAFRAGEHTYGS